MAATVAKKYLRGLLHPDDGDVDMEDGRVVVLGRHGTVLADVVENLVWCTYREGFGPIEPSLLRSDTGWGCMLRCGQMMLANVLMAHLGVVDAAADDERARRLRWRIMSWFTDADRPSAPYGIHHMAQIGALRHNIGLGCWFGPHTTALVLAELVALHAPGLALTVAIDSTVVRSEVEDTMASGMWRRYEHEQFVAEISDGITIQTKIVRRVAMSSETLAKMPSRDDGPRESGVRVTLVAYDDRDDDLGPSWDVVGVPIVEPFDAKRVGLLATPPRSAALLLDDDCGGGSGGSGGSDGPTPIVILIPLRLGLDAINPIYYEALGAVLSFPQSRGMMGGRPNSAFYFVGVQGECVLYLDPHTTQPFVDIGLSTRANLSSYAVSACRKIHLSRLDPTIALAFYCADPHDLDDLFDRIAACEPFQAAPLFSVIDVAMDFSAATATFSGATATSGSSAFAASTTGSDESWEELF